MQLPQPTIVAEYNAGMGGTDVHDQKASYYTFEHRTNKWGHRIFTHFLMAAVVNAHILFTQSTGSKMTLHQFQKALRDELAQKHHMHSDGSDEDSRIGEDEDEEEELERPTKKKATATFLRLATYEDEEWVEKRINKCHTASQVYKDKQRRCVADCGRRITTKCLECNVYLCISGAGDHNCFYRWHHHEKVGRTGSSIPIGI